MESEISCPYSQNPVTCLLRSLKLPCDIVTCCAAHTRVLPGPHVAPEDGKCGFAVMLGKLLSCMLCYLESRFCALKKNTYYLIENIVPALQRPIVWTFKWQRLAYVPPATLCQFSAFFPLCVLICSFGSSQSVEGSLLSSWDQKCLYFCIALRLGPVTRLSFLPGAFAPGVVSSPLTPLWWRS